jgi:glycosyltransferase involved in cell wall biosynthesis
VTLVGADGKGTEGRDGVSILDAGARAGRLRRMLQSAPGVSRLGLQQDADVYHLHDPELLPSALWLKGRGKPVIYDAHEDLPRQVMSKPYLPASVRGLVSAATGALERLICRRLDLVVAATPSIRNRFAAEGIPAEVVNNFPIVGELEADPSSRTERTRSVCYVGSITGIRGIEELIASLSRCRSGARLTLAGEFTDRGLRDAVASLPGWGEVDEIGFVSRARLRAVLASSMAGLVTFLPAPNHIEAQPNKMFEYMSAGLPVIASNFQLWREIIEGNECGICVDPADPTAIAAAIDRFVDDPTMARLMGENGRRAVNERYNWEGEKQKLLEIYEKLA